MKLLIEKLRLIKELKRLVKEQDRLNASSKACAVSQSEDAGIASRRSCTESKKPGNQSEEALQLT